MFDVFTSEHPENNDSQCLLQIAPAPNMAGQYLKEIFSLAWLTELHHSPHHVGIIFWIIFAHNNHPTLRALAPGYTYLAASFPSRSYSIMFSDKPLLNTQSNYTKYYKSRVKLAAWPDTTVTIISEWAQCCRNIKALLQIISWIGAPQPSSPSFLISKV